MSNLVEVKVPDIGDFDSVEVIEILVKVGDVVKAEQSLITVESDKASMEIPSSHAGIVKSIAVKIGDKVKLEAKIIEVTLTDQYSTGINWAAFTNGPNSRVGGGVISHPVPAATTVVQPASSMSRIVQVAPPSLAVTTVAWKWALSRRPVAMMLSWYFCVSMACSRAIGTQRGGPSSS